MSGGNGADRRGEEDDDVNDEAFESSSFGGPSRAVIREHIAQSFKRFDEGDKGWLDRHDLKCAFASLTGYKPSAAELRHVMGQGGHIPFPIIVPLLRLVENSYCHTCSSPLPTPMQICSHTSQQSSTLPAAFARSVSSLSPHQCL